MKVKILIKIQTTFTYFSIHEQILSLILSSIDFFSSPSANTNFMTPPPFFFQCTDKRRTKEDLEEMDSRGDVPCNMVNKTCASFRHSLLFQDDAGFLFTC